jgi:hypothetical protein
MLGVMIRYSAAIHSVGLAMLVSSCTARVVDPGDDEVAETSSETSGESTTETGTGTSSETETETATSSETDTSSETATETATETETATDTSSETATSSETETGEPSECGNAVIEADEACDDGPANAWENACKPDCTLAICGDGHVGPGELCDDPQLCSDDCQIPVGFCGNAIFVCGDLLDNDEDGLIDLYDPDCLSPCDDQEGEYLIDLPQGGAECFLDCYFDSNWGVGDDQCHFKTVCDPLEPQANLACAYDPDYFDCGPQESPCPENCQPLTPNGCDCFGCCYLAGDYRLLDSMPGCSAATPENCHPCTPHFECANPCEPENCELCFGQTIDDLPVNCVEPACPDGVASCSDPYACGPEMTCKTGCCMPFKVMP